MRPYAGRAALMMALVLVSIGVELLPPQLIKAITDRVLAPGQAGNPVLPEAEAIALLVRMIALLLGAYLVDGIVQSIQLRLSSAIGTQVTYDLRSRLFRHLMRLSVSYYDRYSTGQLMSRVVQDTEQLKGLIVQATSGFVAQILKVVAVGLMLFSLNWQLALITLVPAPFVVGAAAFFWRRIYPRYYRIWDARSKLNGALNSILNGVRVVKAFGQERREISPLPPHLRLPARQLPPRGVHDRVVPARHGGAVPARRHPGLVHRRTPRAERRDDAGHAHGVPQLPDDVLRAAAAAHPHGQLAHQLPVGGAARVRDPGHAAADPGVGRHPADPGAASGVRAVRPGRVLLRAQRTGDQRPELRGAAGRAPGRGRQERLRQDHPHQPDRPLLRRHGRRRVDQRRRRAQPAAARAAPLRRRGAAGVVPVPRDDLRQPDLRQPGGELRCRGRGGQGRQRARVHHAEAPGLRHLHRRARRRPVRRAAPARVDRARPALRPQAADPGRGHQQRRHRVRAPDQGRAGAGDRGPHDDRDRPPPEHAQELRPDRGAGRRAPARGGHARGAGAAARHLLPPGQDPDRWRATPPSRSLSEVPRQRQIRESPSEVGMGAKARPKDSVLPAESLEPGR